MFRRLPHRARFARAVAFLGLALATVAPAAARKNTPPTPPADAFASSLLERIDPENLDASRLATAVFQETNRVRARAGRPLLGRLAKLDAAADLQANSVALAQISSHVNFQPALAHLGDRVDHLGLKPRLVAENVALLPPFQSDPHRDYVRKKIDGQDVLIDDATGRPAELHTYASFATTLVNAWMESPGHRANLLNPDFRLLGCSVRAGRSLRGLATIACVQVFSTPLERR